MELPEDDQRFLTAKGYNWQLVPGGDGAFLIVPGYCVNPEVYDRPQTDLMIRIPAQYNLAGLDMYYLDPPLQLRSGGYPKAADNFESHVGRQWQRFSRHLVTPWRPGMDDLRLFFPLINREIKGGILAG